MGFQPKGKDNEGQMAYFTPSSDPYAIWDMHPISEPAIPATFKVTADSLEALKKEGVPESFLTSLSAIKDKSFPNVGELVKAASKGENAKEWQAQQGKIDQKTRINGRDIPGTFRFAHGLGAGDVNGDGRLDVLTTGGWWEQPAGKTDKAWTFHPANLGNANADMYCLDVDGDGVTDVIGSSAHNFGIWWFQGKKDSNGNYSFQQRDLFPKLVSQTHALHFVDINGDGLKDLVTGKRWWAHGPRGDAEPNAPATIFWIEARKGKDGATTFIPHQVDNDSGIGTQFAVADINGDGLPDIITSNKKGVYVFEQVRTKK